MFWGLTFFYSFVVLMFAPNHEQQPKLYTFSFIFFLFEGGIIKKLIITKSKYYGNY